MTGMEICGQITEGPGPGLEGQALDLAPPADTPSVFSETSCSLRLKRNHRHGHAFWTGTLSPEAVGAGHGWGAQPPFVGMVGKNLRRFWFPGSR